MTNLEASKSLQFVKNRSHWLALFPKLYSINMSIHKTDEKRGNEFDIAKQYCATLKGYTKHMWFLFLVCGVGWGGGGGGVGWGGGGGGCVVSPREWVCSPASNYNHQPLKQQVFKEHDLPAAYRTSENRHSTVTTMSDWINTYWINTTIVATFPVIINALLTPRTACVTERTWINHD